MGIRNRENTIVLHSKNIKGLYAVGDIATYSGKGKLIAAGFCDVPPAVNNAKPFIDLNACVPPLQSKKYYGRKKKRVKRQSLLKMSQTNE